MGFEAVPCLKLVSVLTSETETSFVTSVVLVEHTVRGCSLAVGSSVEGMREDHSCTPSLAFEGTCTVRSAWTFGGHIVVAGNRSLLEEVACAAEGRRL